MNRVERYAQLYPGDVLDVIGATIVDVAGLPLGLVRAVVLDDTQQKIRFLEIALPEPDPEVHFIPVDCISAVQTGQVGVNVTAQRVWSAPIVAPDADLPRWAGLYRHYALVPHWEADNIFPCYPLE